MDPNLSAAFVAVCDFCRDYPQIPGGLPTSDPRAQAVGDPLDFIRSWLTQNFPNYGNFPLTAQRTVGAGAFPKVPWVCILPPKQSVADGVYVAICFDKNGKGVVAGCAKSASTAQALETVVRKRRGEPLEIDVDGSGDGTRYNDVFVNPLEILRDNFPGVDLEDHIRKSLKIAMEHLQQPSNVDVVPIVSRPAAPQPVSLPSPITEILHGPPGTGKTYTAILRAVRYADGPEADKTQGAPERFRVLRKEGRVEFITFHQSYGYEDFIEGIRPDLDQGGDTVRFKLVDGVFKRMATVALYACLQSVGLPNQTNFESRYAALLNAIRSAPSGEYKIEGFSGLRWPVWITKKEGIRTGNNGDNSGLYCAKDKLREVFEKFPDLQTISTAQVFSVNKKGKHGSFIAAVFKQLKSLPVMQAPQEPKVEPDYETKAKIVQAFLKNGADSGYTLRNGTKAAPDFVLVIDEINRGNISKIFGELITLIEDDKRISAKNELIVRLPTSGQQFGVPPNLHLVGTMNTADKSIALLDVALRRRFVFKDLPPNFNVCSGLTEPMRKVLAELNDRIERRKDRDHRIGHAFFKDVASETTFDHAFREKVIPLLQEYFFNDFEGARYVLGEEKKNDDNPGFIRSIGKDGSAGAATRWRWFLDYEKAEEFLCYERLKANFQVS